jgi:ferredoxin-NADP reductase
MVDELEPGDQLELPGPIGGYLVWERALASPMLLVPGGSGVVPLRAMLRHHVAAHSPATMRLLYSARSPRDLVYGQELSRLADVDPGVDVQLTFTRHWPANWNGHRGRIDRGPLGRIRPGRRRSDR